MGLYFHADTAAAEAAAVANRSVNNQSVPLPPVTRPAVRCIDTSRNEPDCDYLRGLKLASFTVAEVGNK